MPKPALSIVQAAVGTSAVAAKEKRCMPVIMSWGPTKQRAHVNVVKCKNCPAEYLVGRK